MKGVAPNTNTAQDLMATLLDQYVDHQQCHRGDIVEGVIVSVHAKAILIDIGGKCDALVHPRELEQMTTKDLRALKPGDTANVYVLETSDDSGAMLVSLRRAKQQDDWDRARKLMKNNEVISLSVIDANKGGVIVRLGQLRGFVPGSQLSSKWRSQQNPKNEEHRWDAIIGETLNLCVIEVTSERNRLIFSERRAMGSKMSKRRLLEKLSVGSIHKGIVNNIVAFGAFVNVKGVDGLLHISELSWKRVNNPKEIVHVGQEIQVYILDIDLEKERLGLSLKRTLPDPWEDIEDMYEEDQVVEVEIVNLTNFGAFAALVETPTIEGLIHISELSTEMVEKPEDVVAVGERHTALIISLQAAERRIAFSLKQMETDEVEAPAPESPNSEHKNVTTDT